jgi:hypothetical protein
MLIATEAADAAASKKDCLSSVRSFANSFFPIDLQNLVAAAATAAKISAFAQICCCQQLPDSKKVSLLVLIVAFPKILNLPIHSHAEVPPQS